MAKRPAPVPPSRRHLARARRERMLRRAVLLGTIVTAALVVGVLVYGWVSVNYLEPQRPVAVVNGEPILARDFQQRVRLAQMDLLSQRASTEQLLTLFGDNEQVRASVEQQLQQIDLQLSEPVLLGQTVLNQMIEETLIRQEAERRGIVVTEEDVDRTIAELFGFFPEGTPTPAPTRTPAPTPSPDATALAQTPTVTPGPSPTTPPSPTPVPSPTPYTEEAFQADYQAYLANLQQVVGVGEEALRARVRADLYRQRLLEAFEAEVPRVQEQIHVRHILVEDEETAQTVLERLEAGEAWEDLAAEFSIDTASKDQGGDLGWVPRGVFVDEFEQVAFSAPVGEVVGPVQTSFGWHLIQVLAREERELDEATYQNLVQQAFVEWLSQAREQAEIETFDRWTEVVPEPPTLQGPVP